MKAILGRKIGMSQVFSPEGEMVPVTLILAEPNIISLRRVHDKDGYTAVQLTLPKKKTQEPDGKPATNTTTRVIARKEFPGDLPAETNEVTVAQFTPGDIVQISGISKGKGFQGVVKRHHFKGGPASHGHTDWERRPGSIGQRFPQHTIKGKRMAGRMGADRVTVKKIPVVSVDPALHVLALKGPVPGRRGTVIEIYCE